jgi:hypothetical protein
MELHEAMGLPGLLDGLQIVTDVAMADTVRKQIRFPRSKKKRIRKKWAKNPANWLIYSVPWEHSYQLNGCLVMHPAMLEKVNRALADRNDCQVAPPVLLNTSTTTTPPLLGISPLAPALQQLAFLNRVEAALTQRLFIPKIAW